MSKDTSHRFYVITPYPSMDPIGSPLSHLRDDHEGWEILEVSKNGITTLKVTDAKDDLAEVLLDICNGDATKHWLYHSEENIMKRKLEGSLAYEFVDELMQIVSDEVSENEVTDDHPLEEIRSAFIENGLYETSMGSVKAPAM